MPWAVAVWGVTGSMRCGAIPNVDKGTGLPLFLGWQGGNYPVAAAAMEACACTRACENVPEQCHMPHCSQLIEGMCVCVCVPAHARHRMIGNPASYS